MHTANYNLPKLFKLGITYSFKKSSEHESLLPLLLNHADSHPNALVNRSVAALLIGLKPTTLEVWASTGRSDLPYVKCGRMVRYKLGDIAAYLDRRTRKQTA